MDALTIKLNEVEYKAKTPKTKLFRAVAKFNQQYKDKNILFDESALVAVFELIATAMGDPEITAQRIEDELDMDDLMPSFYLLSEWVGGMVSNKQKQIPKNAPTPAGT